MCMDMSRGVLLRLPVPGGPLEQDIGLMVAMRQAYRVWRINEWMPANSVNPDDDDYEFMNGIMQMIKEQDGRA